MKSIAVIFAGGVGQRMTMATKPKQFLEVNGKPILVYTMEKFQYHSRIDGMILVCVESWIEYAKQLIKQYNLSKVVAVIPGGANGHESRYIGLQKAKEIYNEAIVLVHDGVRPLIDEKTIENAIDTVKRSGSAIVASLAIETIAVSGDGGSTDIVAREKCKLLRAPQCFYLQEILDLFETAKKDGAGEFIDCATLMQYYKRDISIIEGPPENIKITTPLDYYMFKGILEIQNSMQVFGLQ